MLGCGGGFAVIFHQLNSQFAEIIRRVGASINGVNYTETPNSRCMAWHSKEKLTKPRLNKRGKRNK